MTRLLWEIARRSHPFVRGFPHLDHNRALLADFPLTLHHNVRTYPGTLLDGTNPYKARAGSETDGAVHDRFFGSGFPLLPYSTDEGAAETVRLRIKTTYGYPVQTGHTRTRPRRYFARFDSGPSTSTEVLAETLPLAICRLALVIAAKRDPASH